MTPVIIIALLVFVVLILRETDLVDCSSKLPCLFAHGVERVDVLMHEAAVFCHLVGHGNLVDFGENPSGHDAAVV